MTARGGAGSGPEQGGPAPAARWAWYAMIVAVAAEFALGLAALVLVPADRPNGFQPHRGRLVYDLHTVLGVVLLVGSIALAVLARRAPRIERWAALLGLGGVLAAAVGGLLTVSHGLRLLGIVLMFVGTAVAGFAYLAGSLERTPAVLAAADGGTDGSPPRR